MNPNAKATREFAIRDALVSHCGQTLTPDKVDEISEEIIREMESGSTAWAFTGKEPVKYAQLIGRAKRP